VLLDLGMPHMDGLEVARRMREVPGMRQATLVALTGWGQHEDRRRTGEAGFDYHLVKPADVRALKSILGLASRGDDPVRH
jgi:CheY-like chemotaxis protein